MTGELVNQVCDIYDELLTDSKNELLFSDPVVKKSIKQCIYMLEKIREFVDAGKLEKAFRWLGFVQGCLWCHEIRSIDEMRDDNRGHSLS